MSDDSQHAAKQVNRPVGNDAEVNDNRNGEARLDKNDGEKEGWKDRNDNPKPRESNGGQAEIGGRAGPDPTRYGDWEKAGRCIDF